MLQEDIEEEYFNNHKDFIAETDKAWDFIHRALTDGTLGSYEKSYPLSHLILGGQQLYSGDDYIMALKTPEQVAEIAVALGAINESTFRDRFARIDEGDLEHSREQDFEYSWAWLAKLKDFWMRASADQRYVLFSESVRPFA